MGTRAVIAKPAGDGWVGRYHHWDGYPSGLGLTLATALDDFFDGDVETMRRTLVDDEPVGWSTINGADLSLPKAWYDGGAPDPHGPLSFSARGETNELLIRHDGPDCGTEYAYVLTDTSIAVLERRFGSPEQDEGHGTGMFGLGASDTESGGYWKVLGFVDYGDTAAMKGMA